MPLVSPTHCDGLVLQKPQGKQIIQDLHITDTPSNSSTSNLVQIDADFESTVELLHARYQAASKDGNDVNQGSFESEERQKPNGKRSWRQKRQTNERHHEHKKRHGHHGHSYGSHSRRSCATKSAFVYKEEAEDIFGHVVSIYPSIHIGKLAIDQYFYETFCDTEACECSGIDKTRYRSSCETNYSFTYARVIKNGEIGWSQILVRSGCSCVINERKRPKWIGNIMDSI